MVIANILKLLPFHVNLYQKLFRNTLFRTLKKIDINIYRSLMKWYMKNSNQMSKIITKQTESIH